MGIVKEAHTINENVTEEKNFFIFYKPKDIVSGDFYHALSHFHKELNKEIFYLCTADCTGHGVPGALMSMISISRLNESIIEKQLVHPDEILNYTRDGIIASLNPEGSTEESKDGMDCVLCAYDFENKTLEFAAANNPLWLIRNNQLIEYKADKMPVGKYAGEMRPYTLQKTDLQKGDLIYTFTDGFPDQFGGENGKKFKSANFKKLLLSIVHYSMEKQKEILNDTFENWKGNLEQVDDVCIIGVKV
ncbi:MAG: SpoIIE family protein phosphatase [Bacteroidetes bacterium]|nr:SpoIIE family protein phosphatase [Bacteroidota bacterium]HET6245942.1 SpoIIE family protein phosphatase [Bacteroidia bacterium]